MNIKPDMKIGIAKSGKSWKTYSRGNRELDITDEDYRLVLYDSLGRKLMPLLKTGDLHTAKYELKEMCNRLSISEL